MQTTGEVANDSPAQSKPGLRLPAQITLSLRSLGGPIARGTLQAGIVNVPLLNASTMPAKIAHLLLTPFSDERTGVVPQAMEAALTAWVEKVGLEPGEATLVRIGGTVPARPGTYVAQLELVTEAGEVATAPVSVAVAANAGWGVACMVFGLLLLGVLKLLTGEGGVQDKMREVLRTRGEVHAWLQRDPPPLRQKDAVAEIDRNLDEAVRALTGPHPFSVVDRRILDAEAALSTARDDVAKLREALSKITPGTAEVADLTEDWKALQERMQSLSALATPATVSGNGLEAHAAALLRLVWEQMIGLPVQWIASDLAPQLERVRLAQAAGETNRARAMALATRAWLRRAADDLDRRLALIMGLNLTTAGMIANDAWVSRLAAAAELPSGQRADLLDRLAAVDAALATGATLENLATAWRTIGDIELEANRDRAEALKARVQAVAEAAGEEMSVAQMEDAIADLRNIPHPTTEQKAAALIHMLEVWRGRLVVVRDADARARLGTDIDIATASAKRADLAATMQAVHGLEKDWQMYLPRHIAAASTLAVAPVCRDWRDRNLQHLVETSNHVKLQSGRPEIIEWERRLDRARRSLISILPEAVSAPDECLGPVVQNGREIVAVSQEVFTRELADVPIPPRARLDAAHHSGVAAAIALTQQLMTEPRDLKLTPQTPEADRIVGQPVLFVLGGLDPDWGSGVGVVIDWGDGTAPHVTDAENLRQGDRLEHPYREAGTVHPMAISADHFKAATNGEVPDLDGPELGRSDAEVFVRPSPATAAARAADIFLTTQFGLALMIASVVYFWRYQAGPRVFGARGFDYVEAFALGFAAYAAVADLPKMLAGLPFK